MIRIRQGYVSYCLRYFKNSFLEKYKLGPVRDKEQPVVMFGMYNNKDLEFYANHKGRIVVVWCGNDGRTISRNSTSRRHILGQKQDTIHIATSSFIHKDLNIAEIKHITLPITPTEMDMVPIMPRGNKIYCYIGKNPKAYNKALAEHAAKRTGHEIIMANAKTYNKENLIRVYEDSFIGLRLTRHDGVSCTAIELGMAGRRCIFNGDSPNSIPWSNIDDICANINKEYKNRHHNDMEEISESVKEYLDIGEAWLHI